jgi:ribonuclease D
LLRKEWGTRILSENDNFLVSRAAEVLRLSYHAGRCQPNEETRQEHPAERPLVPRTPKEPELLKVTTQGQINELCAEIRAEGRFGFDTEFVMEDRFESEVCLIQISSSRTVAIVDPFLDLDLTPVWGLVSDPAVETVVHAGAEDLALCVQHTGAVPRNVFDLQIALGLAGTDYPLSLQKLVKATLGVQLRKSKTLTDWRKRPLTEAQIRYAALDVQYLLPARDKIHSRLKRKKRLEWLAEECARFEATSFYHRAEEERLLRIKGTGALEGRQLAMVEALLSWREEVARKLNRPARTVLRDHLLVEIARHGLHTPEEVSDLRGLNLSRRHIRELCAATAKSRKLPPEQWPKPIRSRQSERPEEAVLMTLASAVIRGYCMEHGIAYSLAATKKTIGALVRLRSGGAASDPLELLSGWRGSTVGAVVDDVLDGRRSIHVADVQGKRKLRLVTKHPKPN